MTTNNRFIVTMSESAPVSIDPAVWRKIASVDRYDNTVASEANTRWVITVREHEDGRRLVYGVQEAGPDGQVAWFRAKKAGFLIEMAGVGDDASVYAARFKTREAETVRAIRRVAGVIDDEQLAAECIGDLPATEL